MKISEKKEIECADCLAKVELKDWLLYIEGAFHKLQLFFLSIQSIFFWGVLIFAPPSLSTQNDLLIIAQ